MSNAYNAMTETHDVFRAEQKAGRTVLADDKPMPICFIHGGPITGTSIHGEHGYICAACVADCAEILREQRIKKGHAFAIAGKPIGEAAIRKDADSCGKLLSPPRSDWEAHADELCDEVRRRRVEMS